MQKTSYILVYLTRTLNSSDIVVGKIQYSSRARRNAFIFFQIKPYLNTGNVSFCASPQKLCDSRNPVSFNSCKPVDTFSYILHDIKRPSIHTLLAVHICLFQAEELVSISLNKKMNLRTTVADSSNVVL